MEGKRQGLPSDGWPGSAYAKRCFSARDLQYGTTAEFQGAVLDLDDGSASTAESLKC